MRWLAPMVMAFAVGVSGCGGGDKEVVTSFGNFPTGDYCGMLLNARLFISAAFIDPGTVSQEALDELVRDAPKEIRADVNDLAQALTTFTEKVGDDPDVFELEAALTSVSPTTEAAEKHLDAWEKKNCKGQRAAK